MIFTSHLLKKLLVTSGQFGTSREEGMPLKGSYTLFKKLYKIFTVVNVCTLRKDKDKSSG